MTLNDVIKKIACAGKFFISPNLSAPKYWDTIDEIALRVCPKTQISIDKKVVTIPTAANDSVAFKFILPIIAASVKDNMGSEIPEIRAGMANLLICFSVILVLKGLIRNNEKGICFVLERKYPLIFYSHEVRKTFGFSCSVKRYLI